MTTLDLYTLAGCALFVMGLWGVAVRAHLFWKVLGLNVMGGGCFLVLLAAPPRLDPAHADPVPQAMVLTGLVVAVAATAVALGMALRVAARTGQPFLEEDSARPPGDPVAPGDPAARAGPPGPGVEG